MKYAALIFAVSFWAFPSLAYDTGPIWPRIDDIHSFCDDPDRRDPPDPWTQFDGKEADEDVLDLSDGMYRSKKGGLVYVLQDGYYEFYLPLKEKDLKKITVEHEVTFFEDKPAAFIGCSLQQLSEFLRAYKDKIVYDSHVALDAIETLKDKVDNEPVAE